MDHHIEWIKRHLPQFLTETEQQKLSKELRESFPRTTDPYLMYKEIDEESFYQGDGLREVYFPVLNPSTEKYEIRYINGCLLSNTCDISFENERRVEINSCFAQITPLKEYIEQLQQTGMNENKIKGFLESLKKNEISHMMFLPELKRNGTIVICDSIVSFDRVTSINTTSLNTNYNKNYILELSGENDRLFTLSNYGFYVFIVKLSIHFCRLRDGVFR